MLKLSKIEKTYILKNILTKKMTSIIIVIIFSLSFTMILLTSELIFSFDNGIRNNIRDALGGDIFITGNKSPKNRDIEKLRKIFPNFSFDWVLNISNVPVISKNLKRLMTIKARTDIPHNKIIFTTNSIKKIHIKEGEEISIFIKKNKNISQIKLIALNPINTCNPLMNNIAFVNIYDILKKKISLPIDISISINFKQNDLKKISLIIKKKYHTLDNNKKDIRIFTADEIYKPVSNILSLLNILYSILNFLLVPFLLIILSGILFIILYKEQNELYILSAMGLKKYRIIILYIIRFFLLIFVALIISYILTILLLKILSSHIFLSLLQENMQILLFKGKLLISYIPIHGISNTCFIIIPSIIFITLFIKERIYNLK